MNIIQSELTSSELSPKTGFQFSTIPIESLTLEKIALTTQPINRPFVTDHDHTIRTKKWSKWFVDYNKEYLYGIPHNESAILRVLPQKEPEVNYFTKINTFLSSSSESIPTSFCPGCKSGIRYFDYEFQSEKSLDNQEEKWFSGDALKNSYICPPLKHKDILEIDTEDSNNPIFNSYYVPFLTNDYIDPNANHLTKDIQIWLRKQQELTSAGNATELAKEFSLLQAKTLSLEKLIYGLGGLGERTNDLIHTSLTQDGFITGEEGTPSTLFKEIKHYFLPSETGLFCRMKYYPERDCLIAPPWNSTFFLFAEKKRYRKIGEIPREDNDVEKGKLQWFFYKFEPEDINFKKEFKGKHRVLWKFEKEIKRFPNYFMDIVYSKKNKSMFCIPFDSSDFIQIFYDKETDITHFISHPVPSPKSSKSKDGHSLGLKFIRGIVSSVDKNIYCIPFHYDGVVRLKIKDENPFTRPEIELFPSDEWIIEHNEIMTPELLKEMGGETL